MQVIIVLNWLKIKIVYALISSIFKRILEIKDYTRAREGRWNGGIVFGYDINERENSTNKKRRDIELINK